MELTQDEIESVMNQRRQAVPELQTAPEQVRVKLHLVEHEVGRADEHADAVNKILASVEVPRGLLRAPQFKTVEVGGALLLLTEIWVAEPLNNL